MIKRTTSDFKPVYILDMCLYGKTNKPAKMATTTAEKQEGIEMSHKILAERLKNMANTTIDAEFSDILNEAATTLLEDSRQIELLTAKGTTFTITLSPERISGVINEAFINCTGKDFEYVVQAVKEKMKREEEDVKEETT